MDIIVRQARMSDKKKIWKFITIAYPKQHKYKIPDRWYWEYVHNPYAEGDNLPIWIALDNDKIVGQTCVMYVLLKINNQTYKAAWSVDTIVLPKYRGMGIGKKLQRINAASNSIFMSLSMSDRNRSIKKGFGSVQLEPITVYRKYYKIDSAFALKYLLMRSKNHKILRNFVRMGTHWFQVHKVIPLFLNITIKLFGMNRNDAYSDSKIIIKKVEKFGREINVLWDETHHQYGMIVTREDKYLNWKFVDQPSLNYVLFEAEREGKCIGYMVLRKGKDPEPNIGYIIDIYAGRNDKDALQVMISYALDYFTPSVSMVECAVSVVEYAQLLLKYGFFPRAQLFPMFYCDDSIPEKRYAYSCDDFFVTEGDHDWDQYPLPNYS